MCVIIPADGCSGPGARLVLIRKLHGRQCGIIFGTLRPLKSGSGHPYGMAQQDEEGRLLISVSDVGMGLPVGEGNKIFDAFFTTKPQGTGMGLAISRSIVELHGGRLWATANSGQGATFYFTLPNEVAGGA